MTDAASPFNFDIPPMPETLRFTPDAPPPPADLRKAQKLPSLEHLWIDVLPAERETALELKAAAEAILRPLSHFKTTKAALDGLPRQRQRARDALSALTEAAKERKPALRTVST